MNAWISTNNLWVPTQAMLHYCAYCFLFSGLTWLTLFRRTIGRYWDNLLKLPREYEHKAEEMLDCLSEYLEPTLAFLRATGAHSDLAGHLVPSPPATPNAAPGASLSNTPTPPRLVTAAPLSTPSPPAASRGKKRSNAQSSEPAGVRRVMFTSCLRNRAVTYPRDLQKRNSLRFPPADAPDDALTPEQVAKRQNVLQACSELFIPTVTPQRNVVVGVRTCVYT